jgi:hypothetical protein
MKFAGQRKVQSCFLSCIISALFSLDMDALVQEDRFGLLVDLKKLKNEDNASQSPSLTHNTRGLSSRVIVYNNKTMLESIWDFLVTQDKSNSAQCDPDLFVYHLSQFETVQFGLEDNISLKITTDDGELIPDGSILKLQTDNTIGFGRKKVKIHYNAVYLCVDSDLAHINPTCAIFAKVLNHFRV